ncbi:SusC/RagA family TonB-linked outer membrane protein [Sunxiuqinia sp. A32]|uniref:SusC/RagA family TonB-linked outer membrane protein n=1 Tax=Sunxiuqinia sp. A32 TaxID=3461496 RepID=UPI00404529E1
MKKNLGFRDVWHPFMKTKAARIMRLTFFFLLLGLLQVAANSYSQNNKLNLEMKNVKVSDVLQAIENQSKYRFAYSSELIDLDREIDVSIKNQTIGEILNAVFAGTTVNYEIDERLVMLYSEGEKAISQQNISVSGKVTDLSGLPLPGVTVVIKGTTKGTITDTDGNYSFSNVQGDAILVFSFVGMKTQEISLNGKSTVNVVMEEDAIGIEEVVAVGYGIIKKSDLTGSVSAIKEDDFNPGTNGSLEQLVAGKVAGVQITQNSAEPGGGISVRIRGVTSVNAGNEPLYVIDGLPIDNTPMLSGGGAAGVDGNQARNPLNSLNPNDIASIEILKDASATAIYGARGANGVILVTTKKGKKGKASVNYDFNVGVQTVKNRYDLLSTSEYMQVINELSVAEGKNTIFSSSDISNITGTDWQDEVLRTAMVQDHNISVAAGNENTSFFASFNYFNQDGVVENTGIEKYIGRVNVEQKIGDKAKIGVNLNTSVIYDNNAIDNTGINESAGPIYSALLYDPTESVYDENGELTLSSELTVQNPVRLIKGIDSRNVTNRTFGTAYVEYNITDNLQAKFNFGNDRATSRRDIYNSRITYFGSGAGGACKHCFPGTLQCSSRIHNDIQ